MDWGLFAILPNFERLKYLFIPGKHHHERHIATHERPFLRPLLLYRQIWSYYLCIVLDLILRFLWVISLVPLQSTLLFVRPAALSVFLGSMEIIRRSIWGHFRVEYESVKLILKGAPGFIETHPGLTLDKLQDSVDSLEMDTGTTIDVRQPANLESLNYARGASVEGFFIESPLNDRREAYPFNAQDLEMTLPKPSIDFSNISEHAGSSADSEASEDV